MGQWSGAKAIETQYAGCRFRSRLEARWAVFLDALDVTWRYEMEGFDLDDLWYLPDFWLPDLGFWVEVKPVDPSEPEMTKARRLAQHTGKPVLMVVDVPGTNAIELGRRDAFWFRFNPAVERVLTADQMWWTECPFCHRIAVSHLGEYGTLLCGCAGNITCAYEENKEAFEADTTRGPTDLFRHTWLDYALDYWQEPRIVHSGWDSPRLCHAYEAATSARFGT